MNIEYRTYTVKDLREWLFEDKNNGLTEEVISKVRAYSFLHNPYITDDMVVVVVAYDNEKIVGYTAMFPDKLVKPDVTLSCATTLYADPDYAGEFIGYYVSKKLHDTADGRLVVGSDIAEATVMIDKLLGLHPVTINKKRFILNRRLPADTSLRLLKLIREKIKNYQRRKALNKIYKSIESSMRIEYTDFIDNETYRFIASHSSSDAFLRSQEMLNWILRYPFTVNSPCYWRQKNHFHFGSEIIYSYYISSKIWRDDEMVGFYTLMMYKTDIRILWLYYEPEYKEQVFSLLVEDTLSQSPRQLWSIYHDFNTWLDSARIAIKSYEVPLVFTHPKSLELNSSLILQGGDGDMFA